jgi:hypothetical protein
LTSRLVEGEVIFPFFFLPFLSFDEQWVIKTFLLYCSTGVWDFWDGSSVKYSMNLLTSA